MYIIPFLEKSNCDASYSVLLYNLAIADCYVHGYCTLGKVCFGDIVVTEVNSIAYQDWVSHYTYHNGLIDPEYIAKLIDLNELIDSYPEIMSSFNGSDSYEKVDIYNIYLDAIRAFVYKMLDFLKVINTNVLKLYVPHTDFVPMTETLLIEIPF